MLLQVALKSGYIATQIAENGFLLHGAAEYGPSGFSSHLPLATKLAEKGLTPVWFSAVCF